MLAVDKASKLGTKGAETREGEFEGPSVKTLGPLLPPPPMSTQVPSIAPLRFASDKASSFNTRGACTRQWIIGTIRVGTKGGRSAFKTQSEVCDLKGALSGIGCPLMLSSV